MCGGHSTSVSIHNVLKWNTRAKARCRPTESGHGCYLFNPLILLVMNKDLHLLGQLTTELLINAEEFGDGCLGTAGTLVPEDVEMLTRVEAFCQEPKVYIVEREEVDDYTEVDYMRRTFLNYEDAKKCFDSELDAVRADFAESDWVVEEFDSYFEAYDDGYYARNHFVLSLTNSLVE